jgi:hypothetical protein
VCFSQFGPSLLRFPSLGPLAPLFLILVSFWNRSVCYARGPLRADSVAQAECRRHRCRLVNPPFLHFTAPHTSSPPPSKRKGKSVIWWTVRCVAALFMNPNGIRFRRQGTGKKEGGRKNRESRVFLFVFLCVGSVASLFTLLVNLDKVSVPCVRNRNEKQSKERKRCNGSEERSPLPLAP